MFNSDPHIHSNDRLYSRDKYRCTVCNMVHGTHLLNSAVKWALSNEGVLALNGGHCHWACPNEFVPGPNHHAPAKQDYLGYVCSCGDLIVPQWVSQ